MDGEVRPDLEALVAEQRANLARDGYSILEGAFSADFCDEVLVENARMAGVWPRSLVQEFHGRNTVRYFDLLNAAPIFQKIPVGEKMMAVVRAELGKDCLLGTYGTVSIGPGEPAQMLHADDSLYQISRSHPKFFLNVIVALNDFTEENGATRVVPGSHLWDHYPAKPPIYKSVPAVMPKGSVCFVPGETYHGGGANRTQGVRHGITIAYVSSWIRPQENFQVAVSQERAATFDPELQALIGWRLARTGVGHIYTRPEHFSGPMAHKLAMGGT